MQCDKRKPECSQCVRVSKKCPGYRDQLSLMFRDESSKVMQKAHAQWGVEAAESSGSSSSSSSASSSSDSPSPPSSTSSVDLSPVSTRSDPSPPARSSRAAAAAAAAVVARRNVSPAAHYMEPSWQDKGIRFFIDHFVIGLPDEAADVQSLGQQDWVFHRHMQNTMAAVGLAGMGNLRNDKQLMSNAHSTYGAALRDTGKALAAGTGGSYNFMIRSVLMLAMFEVRFSGLEASVISCSSAGIACACSTAKDGQKLTYR